MNATEYRQHTLDLQRLYTEKRAAIMADTTKSWEQRMRALSTLHYELHRRAVPPQPTDARPSEGAA